MDVIEPIRAVPPSHYQAYLNSPGWRTVRNRALWLARFQCSKCPSRRDLEVHHLTYERLGLERDSDVEVLCTNCHRSEHLQNPEQTSLGVYLKIASWALIKEPFGTVSDLADAMKVHCVRLKVAIDVGRINSALTVVCGNRLMTAPKKAPEPLKADPRPVSTGEARELLQRLRAKFGEPLHVRQIPAPKVSREIDIYAPIAEPNWGEHDRY